MKVPMSWLKEYTEFDLPISEFVDRMIMHGLGVEGVEELFEEQKGILVGKILSVEKHPNADKLQVVKADVGTDTLTILTAATNVYAGMICPVATDGAVLPNGKKITAGEMRGLISAGMLCGAEELMVDEQDFASAGVYGILDLGNDYATKIGEPFYDAAELNTPVVEFEISANRGDCMSVVGIAREVSAALGTPFHMPKIAVEETEERAEDYVKVTIEAPDLCTRYIARAMKEIRIQPSPCWMQRRLLGTGIRAISNIVDITNYVMMELGYPMHAFDYNCVQNGHIVVRRAKQGEELTTLDGKQHTLDEEILVIADESRAIGLAGVMGGENSEITEQTQMVLLENARFDGGNNRKTSRKLGILSESAGRFTKGLDDEGIEIASDRAAQLMVELGCAKVLCGKVDTRAREPEEIQVSVRYERVNQILGTDLPIEVILECLQREHIEAEVQADGETIICKIPSYRQDLRIEEDLIEEVARISGYDQIPSCGLNGVANGGMTVEQSAREKIRDILVQHGYYETMSISFVGKKLLDMALLDEEQIKDSCVVLQNPLSEEYSRMRPTLIPSMINSLSVNARNKIYHIPMFEISNVHVKKGEEDLLPPQSEVLCLGQIGETFFDLKGMLMELFRCFGITALHFAADGPSYYHPGRKATISYEGKVIGEIGELHPQVLENFSLDHRICIAQIKTEAIYKNIHTDVKYRPLNRYPSVERDLAVIVERDTPVGDMMDAIRAVGGEWLRETALFDIFQGEQIGEGKKSVAFRLIFQAESRTLTGEEVNEQMQNIVQALAEQYGAVMRQ